MNLMQEFNEEMTNKLEYNRKFKSYQQISGAFGNPYCHFYSNSDYEDESDDEEPMFDFDNDVAIKQPIVNVISNKKMSNYTPHKEIDNKIRYVLHKEKCDKYIDSYYLRIIQKVGLFKCEECGRTIPRNKTSRNICSDDCNEMYSSEEYLIKTRYQDIFIDLNPSFVFSKILFVLLTNRRNVNHIYDKKSFKNDVADVKIKKEIFTKLAENLIIVLTNKFADEGIIKYIANFM